MEELKSVLLGGVYWDILRQEYIVGRKFLKYDRIIFEFSGQHNIPLKIQEINLKYQNNVRRNYFVQGKGEEEAVKQDLMSMKYNIYSN